MNKSRSMSGKSWSIRRRLTILYVLSAFGILFLSTIFLYWVLTNRLEKEDGEFLAAKIRLLREVLAEQPNNQAIIQEEIEWEGAPFRLAKYYARILAVGGRIITETKNMSAVAPAGIFPQPAGVMQAPSEPTTWKSNDGHNFLLMSALARLGDSNSETRILQLALDVSHEDEIISDYRRQLSIVLFAGIFLSAVIGIFIARKGLKPLDEITATIHHVSASQLHERLGQSGWPLELSSLAVEFDEMLDRLEQSFNRLSQFSADLAHELRTPINNLIGETEVALTRNRSLEDYREVLQSGLEEYSRLSHVIESLLFIARAESPETQINRTQFDVREQIQSLIEFYEAMSEEQGLEITCEGDSTVNADQTLFRQAANNLVSNAIQYTLKGGKILIQIKSGLDNAVDISVSDSGAGIEQKHLPRVFDRFYRGDNSRSKGKPGSGLGLAIVKSIMQLHHGTASIVSEPGKGTTVTLSFPA
jgi:two-component system heavy metal sensor histidine kinase CusS